MNFKERKIAFFLEALSGGGAEHIMTELANSLADRNIRIEVVLSRAEGPFVDDVSDNAKIINFNLKSFYFSFPKLITYLKREKPSLIISTLDLANLILLISVKLAGVKTKTVIRVANTVSKQYRTPIKKWLEKILLKWIYPWADEIICVSQGVATDLSEYAKIPLERIHVIYSPVITPGLLQQLNEPVNHPWYKLNMPPIIVGVGRLTKQKNFSRLIKAFYNVNKEMEANLLILGDGEERESLTKLIKRLELTDKVDLPGFVKNPYPYMANASVFVLSSDWEGLPIALIEAMACGCPVVSTDCPSGPSEILAGGKYGYLVPLGDDQALIQAMLDVLSGRAKKSEPAWLDQFTLETGLGNYIAVFENLIGTI